MDANAVKVESSLPVKSGQLKFPHTVVARARRSDENWISSGTSVLDQEQSLDDASFCSTSPVCAAPVARQFWKAGVYNDELTPKSTTQSGSTYLHIHPRFLHSNATSHKWVFGAVAELIDNAVDEIQNGATFVNIDKTINPRNGTAALLIQDDGSGMDPEAMRRCLSFGFSDKSSISAIGKYGNGFKTSSMRLGADVIVFSRNITNRKMTQSIGLLSYTFLTRECYNRIVVPMVYYEFNFVTGSFDAIHSEGNDNSNLNLRMLLQWSPFSTEEELLKQDIRITRDALGKMKDSSRQAETEKHLANRLRYSLRAYLSILYLKLPETFAIVLRGKVVIYRNVATDLKYTEFIMYKPAEGSVITTIGFIKEAPLVSVHGFNVYHKNRLILPFCPMVGFSANRGRGVVGILEANFIEPTHDKQDFEKTSIFQKLVHRLKEMTWEYWDYHCGLLGYHIFKKPRLPSATPGASNFIHQHGTEQPVPLRKYSNVSHTSRKSPMITIINSKAAFESKSLPTPIDPSLSRGFHEGSNLKRKTSGHPAMFSSEARMEVNSNKVSNLPDSVSRDAIDAIEKNRMLRARFSEFNNSEQQLKLKVTQLKLVLDETQAEYARLLAELQYLEKVKWEATF